jgi:AraC-like DNA-binding protein
MTKRTDKLTQMGLLTEYFALLAPLAHDASQAFGSRATASPEHTISQKFTTLLAEYHSKGGSLLLMSDALGITYPALRRRVMTAGLAPLPRGKRSKATASDYQIAVIELKIAKAASSAEYHRSIKKVYDRGVSLNKLATHLGLKSAYPLYYGLNKARLAEDGK